MGCSGGAGAKGKLHPKGREGWGLMFLFDWFFIVLL